MRGFEETDDGYDQAFALSKKCSATPAVITLSDGSFAARLDDTMPQTGIRLSWAMLPDGEVVPVKRDPKLGFWEVIS